MKEKTASARPENVTDINTPFPVKKFTLKELKDIQDSLARILDARLPARVGYRMTKFSKRVIEELQDMINARDKIIKKLGERKEDGNWKVKPENLAKFQDELEELWKEEIELPFMKIKISEIENVRDDRGQPVLSMLDIANLEFMIEDPPEKAND